ncbi:MAG: translation initiation factor IF-2 [Thermoplasmatota archaeon]
MPRFRQPIVSVLGHVDHGKTTLLDAIRGCTNVAGREAGRITQHIGASEIPLEAILERCGGAAGGRSLRIPGLLFIDTPGHQAFTTLRARGGSLADLAVLVVDIMEGFRPQTVESLHILKRYGTKFLVAANKVDLIPGWRAHRGVCLKESLADQPESAAAEMVDRLYKLSESFSREGVSAEWYQKVSDFERNVAIVPVSAKHGEGVPDLLLVLVGLAQKFLEEELRTEEGPAEGTVLEVKEEKGLGKTLDAIIYSGTLRRGDTILVGTCGRPLVTKVKALLRPKPLDEIRDPRQRFDSVASVTAAVGIKLSAQTLDGVVAGAPLRVVVGEAAEEACRVEAESRPAVETAEEGVTLKADAIGSLEALAFELKSAGIPIKRAEVGEVCRRDVVEAAPERNPLHRAILAFNSHPLPDAREELAKGGVALFENNIIYKLIEDYMAWRERRAAELETDRRAEFVHPGKFRVLPGCVFRISKPALVGVRVLAGRLRPGQSILREDGRVIGRIKSIQKDNEPLKEALTGQEVAVAIEGVTVGRQMSVDDVLYVDIPEAHVRELRKLELNHDELECLDRVCEIHSKEKPFWGK